MQRNIYLSSTYFQLPMLHPPHWNVMVVGMYQYNQNKIDGFGTEFEKGMHFYVPLGVILIELEECSDYATEIESRGLLHNGTGFVPSNDTMATSTTPSYNNMGLPF
jgi:hypothetical protein